MKVPDGNLKRGSISKIPRFATEEEVIEYELESLALTFIKY